MHTPSGEQEGQTSIEIDEENMSGKNDDVQISIHEQQEQTSNEEERNLEQHDSSTRELSSSSSATASIELSGEDKELIRRIKDKQIADGEAKNDKGSQMKIQKVPKFIRDNKIFMENYCREPKVIAIGCFYAHCPDLKKTDLKDRMVGRFVMESGKTVETLLSKFKESFTLDKLKELFEQQVITNKDDELPRMLFVDGCFLLQFIHDYVNNDIKESVEISKGEVEDIRHDLFLLENQIPYKVLVILMELSDKGSELEENLYAFVSMNTLAPFPYTFLQIMEKKYKGDNKQVIQVTSYLPFHLLDLLRSELSHTNITITTDRVKDDEDEKNLPESCYRRSFRNIQDLNEVGISLKPDYSKGLRSVSFSSRLYIFGQLNLPPIIVDETTKQKLLNLVAYEMCPGNNDKNYTVTSYVRLLDTLIDSEQDVKDLRAAQILRNNLSSDEQVAQLFNTIGSILVPQDAYSSVIKDIQKHYEKKLVIWKGEFSREYCRNPWTLLTLLAGLAAFILGGIQTYYTVNPKK